MPRRPPCDAHPSVQFRLPMVKTIHVHPRPRVMAGLAPKLRAILPPLFHPVFELAMMRVQVARRALTVGKLERQDLVRAARQSCLVAFRAGYRRMASRQGVGRLLMFGNGVGRAVKVRYGMAAL